MMMMMMMMMMIIIIYMKKSLDSDWLKVVQLKCNTNANYVIRPGC